MNNNAENAIELLEVLKSTLEECGHPFLAKFTTNVETIKSLVKKNEIDAALTEANELLSVFAKNDIVFIAAKINDAIEYIVKINTTTQTA